MRIRYFIFIGLIFAFVRASATDDFDALCCITDTIPSSTEKNNGVDKSNAFYDSLATRANRKPWTKNLHHAVVRNAPQATTPVKKIGPRDNLLEHSGKYIRTISIRQLDVFGPSVTDTAKKGEHWLEKSGNALHVQTNKRFIENNLFISEGERVDPYLISDNERILRSISSIQDVRIVIQPSALNADSVDVVIITKDVMPYGVSWEALDVAYGEASIWNSNLLGMGHSLNYTTFYNLNREPKYGYNIKYKINNLSNTFTSAEFQHTNKYHHQSTAVNINRRFITPAIRFGGAFRYAKVNNTFTLVTIDTTVPDLVAEYEQYDAWVGHNIPAKNWISNKLRKNYFISGRAQSYHFFERPTVAEDSLYTFQNRNSVLGSIGVTWQGYHSTNLVYGFGNTEDLPYGTMVKLTAGYERSQFHKRPYVGSTITVAKFLSKYGYLTSTVDFGTFFNNEIEQGVLNVDLLHISPLIGGNRHRFRNFLSANYTEGINRYSDEFTFIEDKEGVSGFSQGLLKGDKRFYLNNEFVYYSPQYIYGFRLIYYMYSDFAMINHNNSTLIDNPLYIGTGIGVRIRNERLVFNTVQIRLSFYPLAPGISESDKQYVNLTSFPEYRMPEFANRRPEIIEF